MTVISAEETVSTEDLALVKWMMEQIGEALILPEKHMDACTALCGSGPAFYALMLEAMSDGAVMMGLPRAEAQMMAANSEQPPSRAFLCFLLLRFNSEHRVYLF